MSIDEYPLSTATTDPLLLSEAAIDNQDELGEYERAWNLDAADTEMRILRLSVLQCQPIRNDLAACLMQTDCVQKNGKTGQECLRDHLEELPSDCQLIYKSYVNCRRGLLDMRKRFRGNAPTASRDNNPPGGTSTIESSVSLSNEERGGRGT